MKATFGLIKGKSPLFLENIQGTETGLSSRGYYMKPPSSRACSVTSVRARVVLYRRERSSSSSFISRPSFRSLPCCRHFPKERGKRMPVLWPLVAKTDHGPPRLLPLLDVEGVFSLGWNLWRRRGNMRSSSVAKTPQRVFSLSPYDGCFLPRLFSPIYRTGWKGGRGRTAHALNGAEEGFAKLNLNVDCSILKRN